MRGITRASCPVASSNAWRWRAHSWPARASCADEPTGSLDQATGAQISDLLFALNATSDTTLVLVTHDMTLAQRCRHIYRIDSGRLHAQTGPAA